MIRQVIIFSVLFMSSCSVLNKKKITSHNKITIYANTKTSLSPYKGIKIKTKINILKDSIVFSAAPILGLELAKLTLTDEFIYIEQKITNKIDTLKTTSVDSKLKLKHIKKFIAKPKKNQDTTNYKNGDKNAILTNYINKQSVFLPQKVVFWTDPKSDKDAMRFDLEIDYRSIKFLPNK